MVGVFSHTGKCIQDNGRNCLTVVQLYSQDFWMQSSSNFSPRNSCYEIADKNKAFLKKYLGVLVFKVLVFVVLVFEVLAFEVLVFEVLVFDFLNPSFLEFCTLFRYSALANNLELDEKLHILVKMVGVFSHTGRCIQDNCRNCLNVVQLYSQDFGRSHQSVSLQGKLLGKIRKQSFPLKNFRKS